MFRRIHYRLRGDFLCVVSLLWMLVVPASGCTVGDFALDEQDEPVWAECRLGEEPFPLGRFANQKIFVNYDRLVPLPDPKAGFDRAYAEKVLSTPRMLEQLYYDAAQGHERAAWFVCELESSLDSFARSTAEYLTTLRCPDVSRCAIALEKVPYSPNTISGMHVLSLLRTELEAQATLLPIRRELVARAITLLGVEAAPTAHSLFVHVQGGRPRARVRRSPADKAGAPAHLPPPPRFQLHDDAAAGPEKPRGFRSFAALENALGLPGPGKYWHLIVEATPENVKRFGPERLHSTRNIIAVDTRLHRQIKARYLRTYANTRGETLRQWLSKQPFEIQRQYGLDILRSVGAIP